jgi:hypothetical protein
MTSTVPKIEGAMARVETASRVEAGTNDFALYEDEHHRSPRMIYVSHQGVYSNISVPVPSPVYAGQLLEMYYVATWREPLAEGSTGLMDIGPLTEEAIRSHLDWIIALSADEVFFDGMESRLSFGLKHLLGVGGNATIQAIRSLIDSGSVNVEAVGEILRVFGDFDDRTTHLSRLSVLLECLRSRDSRIRDAASIGIASLDDPSALKEVEEAVEREPILDLRQDLQLILDQLRAGQCRHS